MKRMNLFLAVIFCLAPLFAHADDWPCTVVMCLANPQGPTATPACVPPIQKLWSELAKGHAFPSCNMNTGEISGNSATNQMATANNCPPQYEYWSQDGSTVLCRFSGVVSINFAGKPFSRIWWGGNSSVTENLSSDAISSPGSSTQFQDDYAVWKKQQDAIDSANQQGGGH